MDKAYQETLRNAGDGHGMVEAGNVAGGLDLLAQKGDWDQVFAVGAKNAPDELPRFAAMYANKQVDEGNFDEAVHTLSKFGAPPTNEHYGLYNTIINQWATRTEAEMGVNPDSDRDSHDLITEELRGVVYHLVAALKSRRGPRGGYEGKGGGGDNMVEALERSLLVLHYSALHRKCRKEKLPGLAAKLSTGLLRFCGAIPADKAFFHAGMACKENGDLSQAFVFLNHYLDLTEAIDDGDASMMDHSDFVDTDLPSPVDYDLPKQQHLSEERREEVRDWVLALSMDQKVEQALSTRECSSCNSNIYAGSLLCVHCKAVSEACIVSAAPVIKTVSCKKCGNKAQGGFKFCVPSVQSSCARCMLVVCSLRARCCVRSDSICMQQGVKPHARYSR